MASARRKVRSSSLSDRPKGRVPVVPVTSLLRDLLLTTGFYSHLHHQGHHAQGSLEPKGRGDFIIVETRESMLEIDAGQPEP